MKIIKWYFGCEKYNRRAVAFLFFSDKRLKNIRNICKDSIKSFNYFSEVLIIPYLVYALPSIHVTWQAKNQPLWIVKKNTSIRYKS